jgi:hypothetical protein
MGLESSDSTSAIEIRPKLTRRSLHGTRPSRPDEGGGNDAAAATGQPPSVRSLAPFVTDAVPADGVRGGLPDPPDAQVQPLGGTHSVKAACTSAAFEPRESPLARASGTPCCSYCPTFWHARPSQACHSAHVHARAAPGAKRARASTPSPTTRIKSCSTAAPCNSSGRRTSRADLRRD